MVPRPIPGQPAIVDGELRSHDPATGAEVARFPVTTAGDLATTLSETRLAASAWSGIDFTARRNAMLRFAAILANRANELAVLVNSETGKPVADAILEISAAIEHWAWAARNARRVLRARKTRPSLLVPGNFGRKEYCPYGVIGVIGPWNYPVFTPLGSIGGALAAGNAVIFKPSEYSPATGDWLATAFREAVPGYPVLSVVHGAGETGAALCRAGVDKIAFTGSAATGRAVMSACAETLTPVVLECGGKDAAIVADDADLAAAADACAWGGLSNAGQTCVGIERIYVVASVYSEFLRLLVDRARRLRVGDGPDADLGPITVPRQLTIISQHIEDALARGARAVLGGAEAVQPPYVHPTILVDVPEDALAVTEETFGPTLTVRAVADTEEALRLANAGRYRLGGAVFSRRRGLALARRMRSGLTSVNSAMTFTAIPTLPFGGVGHSGFGRVHGDDGLREFAWVKSIAWQRFPSPLPALTFRRAASTTGGIERLLRLRYGRRR